MVACVSMCACVCVRMCLCVIVDGRVQVQLAAAELRLRALH